MITVKLKNRHEVPSRWSDFTTDHRERFISLCSHMEDFEKGLITFGQFKVLIVFALLGADPESIRVPGKKADSLYENIFRISELLDFPYMLQDNDDGTMTAYIRISLSRNLMGGYSFEVSPAGLVECSLKAEQYVDALSLMELYSQTRADEALTKLCKSLNGTSEGLSRKEMVAIYYNFRGILDWIQKLPQYSILFCRSSRRKGGESPLGLSSSIFALSKSGYGTLKEIQDLDVFTYLAALVQMSIESIRQLAAAGLKPGQIADKLNIPVSEVLPHVTEIDDYEHSI